VIGSDAGSFTDSDGFAWEGRSIENAKRRETRIWRIEKTLDTLRNLESAGRAAAARART
jgi:hypothetical protein